MIQLKKLNTMRKDNLLASKRPIIWRIWHSWRYIWKIRYKDKFNYASSWENAMYAAKKMFEEGK